MKFTKRELTVAISKTVNTGNYESMKIHAGLSAEIRDSADIDEAYNELYEECTKQVLDYEEQILGG